MKYSLLSKYRAELMGIAMLAVMLFHAGDLDFKVEALNYIRSIGFGGVDIFVLLSGLGLAMSLAKRRQEYGAFMSRRLWRILPAYYAVMLPYTLCLLIVDRAELTTFVWNSLLLNYWVRPVGSFNWYVTGIVLFYAVTPQLFCLLNDKRRRLPALIALVLLSLGVCQVLMRGTYWNHLDIFYRFPMFALGILIGLWVNEDRSVKLPDAIVWCVLLAVGVWYALIFPGLGDYAPLAHLFLFTTVPVCLILAWLMDKLPLRPVLTALRFIGNNSLEIYLLNVSFLSEAVFLRRFFDPDPGHYIYYAAVFALNILLGWVLHKAVELAVSRFRGKTSINRPVKF